MSELSPIKTRSKRKFRALNSIIAKNKLTPIPKKRARKMSREQELRAQIEKINAEIIKMGQAHQIQVDQLNDEMLGLRQLNKAQNEQLTIARQHINELTRNNNNNQNNDLMQTLLGGFRALNIDAKPPKFVESQNPQKFI